MAASDMMSALMELCQERHIDQLYLIDRLEQSLAKSYAEILHLEWGAKVTIDRTTGKIYVYRLEPIDDSMDEEGNFTEFEEIDVTPKNTSRIAAQHAKAEINAIVRNSAREQIYEEFSGRIGDLISGTVLQSTPDFTIVKIRDGVEAELPHFERLQREYGDRVSVVAIHSNLITEDVQAFLDAHGWQLPFAQDPDGGVIAALGGSTMLPMTVILDAQGVIVYNKVGSVTYEQLESLIAPLL